MEIKNDHLIFYSPVKPEPWQRRKFTEITVPLDQVSALQVSPHFLNVINVSMKNGLSFGSFFSLKEILQSIAQQGGNDTLPKIQVTIDKSVGGKKRRMNGTQALVLSA